MAISSGIPSGNTLLTFTCANVNVTDSAGNPAQIVPSINPFTVSTDLDFAGQFGPFIVALLQFFGATYTATYSVESETGGFSGTLGTNSGPIAGLTTTSTFTVLANTLNADVYELTAVVTFAVPGFSGTVPITGFFSDLDVQVF